MPKNQDRISEFDYLRSVCIILMVMFHLVWFADKHLLLKQFVYTFHMPVFLLISGYLTNTNKTSKCYLQSLLRLFLPYAVMETGYTVMASLLPIREHINSLDAGVLFEKVLLHPIGPYWFLHTLILLQALLLVASRLSKANTAVFATILILATALLSNQITALLSFDNAIYFIIGAIVRHTKTDLLRLFAAKSPLPFLLLLILCLDTSHYQRGTLAGIAVVWAVISSLLCIYNRIGAHHLIIYIGRNTLPILLFSPVFTLLVKQLVPLFSFDQTAISFMAVSVVTVLAGSILIAKISDITGLSCYFAGKKLCN